MTDLEESKKVVQRLLDKNNVKLKDLTQNVLHRIAGQFRAAGLIAKDVEESMLVMGVDPFTLATKLVNACETSLVEYPEENFSKFTEILKGHETMKPLAAEMESEFKQARKSSNTLVSAH